MIATRLPTVFDQTKEYHYLSGLELKAMDIEKDEKDNPLIDGMKYKWSFPVMLARNHYRRLKSIYEKGGEPEVIKYIREVKSMQKVSEPA